MDDVVLQMIGSFVAVADMATDPSFEAFRSAWLQSDLPLLFEVRLDQEPLDLFIERILFHFMDLLLNMNPYEKRVLFAWLVFALYAIYREQPAEPRNRIPLAWSDWSGYVRLLKFASQSADLSNVWIALYQLHKDDALKYCIARRCAPVAPHYQQSAPLEPLHRLIDVDNLRNCLEEYDQEAAGFRGELELKTAQIFDTLEELDDILSLRRSQQRSTAVCANNALLEEPAITEANLEAFNADQVDSDGPLFLSYRRDHDQSSTDYDEADAPL